VSPPGWSRAPDWLDSRYRRDCDDAAQAAARACEHQRAGPAVLNTPAPYDQVQQAEPYPDDTQGWLRWVETLEAPGREMLSALTPPDHRLARTEVELDGVRTYTSDPTTSRKTVRRLSTAACGPTAPARCTPHPQGWRWVRSGGSLTNTTIIIGMPCILCRGQMTPLFMLTGVAPRHIDTLT